MIGVLLLLAQAQVVQTLPTPKRPLEIVSLTDQARGVPPEFSADLLLRIAGSTLITESKWKRELIEDAFVSAAHAPLPYRQSGSSISTDTRWSQEWWPNDLEKLTLQTRAVDAMLPLDRERALAMFQGVVIGEIAAPTCQDAVSPDLSSYYKTATDVFRLAFTAEQRKKERDVQFLVDILGAMHSAAQVVPILKLLAEVELTDAQRQPLTAKFAATLETVASNDRIFGKSEPVLVSAAVPAMHDSPLLLPALRAYIVRNESGVRCSGLRVKVGTVPASVASFNTLLAKVNPVGALYKPITDEESKPLKDGGTFDPKMFWQSKRSKEVLDALKWLNHGNRNLPDNQRFWTLEERSTKEWDAHYHDLLKLIEAWKEEEEASAADYYFMVAHTFESLAALVPPGPAREDAMSNFLSFVEQRYAALENHNLWFVMARSALQRANFSKDPKDKAWIFDRMARSGNPVIAAYAQVAARIGMP
jgi:hypothetical protein